MRVKTLTVMVVLISGMMVAPALMFSFTPGFELAGTVSAASDHVVYVGGTGPGNYSSIQAGIDAATENGTVYVYPGTYHENVVIDKSVSFIGEDNETTIIEGSEYTDIVHIMADYVTFSGFTVLDDWADEPMAGIALYSNYTTVTGSIIKTNDTNIALYDSGNNTIAGNIIADTNTGISLTYSHNNIITGNTISNANMGIELHISSNNTLMDNVVGPNHNTGIFLHTSCNDNILRANTVSNNGWDGLEIYMSKNNTVSDNTIESNGDIGIRVSPASEDNVIYHNNLVDNGANAYDQGQNTWYNTTLEEGNYWSDFDEASEGAYDNDSDGIIDTPYNVSGDDNQDLYPLAMQWQPDYAPPVTTLSLLPATPNGNNGWYVSSVKATLTAIDEESGVETTKYRKNDGSWRTYAGQITLQDGVHSLSYYSVDVAGNQEDSTTRTVRIDTTASATTLTAFVDGVETIINESQWYDDDVTVELDIDDGGASPVTTYYRFVGETRAFQSYTEPLEVTAEGVHRLEYFSRDKAGNAEPLHNLTIQIDRTAPQAEVKTPQASYLYVMGRELIPLEGFDNAAVVIGPVPVEIDAVDAVSGIHEVRFYVDDTLQRVDNTTPYTWEWDETVVGPYNIEVEVENGAGDVVDRDIPVIVVNWKT
ncbi:MAG: NosD domain-containing protein [Thermoplasmatota archaeon]